MSFHENVENVYGYIQHLVVFEEETFFYVLGGRN